LTRAGLPVGIQLVARRWHEQTLFRAGTAFQSVTDWHRRRPQLQSA
jgi:Asp-tRNA(Asn)/Glu-tRNA(Gln) amidotransferase A subunit family amidase